MGDRGDWDQKKARHAAEVGMGLQENKGWEETSNREEGGKKKNVRGRRGHRNKDTVRGIHSGGWGGRRGEKNQTFRGGQGGFRKETKERPGTVEPAGSVKGGRADVSIGENGRFLSDLHGNEPVLGGDSTSPGSGVVSKKEKGRGKRGGGQPTGRLRGQNEKKGCRGRKHGACVEGKREQNIKERRGRGGGAKE